MGNLLSLYFLHPFSNRLANKTQRIYSRYELTNPTKNPTPSFCFLPSLCYSPSSTLHTPTPLSLCYYPLFLCYSVSYSPVTISRSFVTLSPHPLSLSSVPLLLCLLLPCHLILCLPCPPSLSCKECLPVLSTGAFTLSKTRPFKHAEHAFLAP